MAPNPTRRCVLLNVAAVIAPTDHLPIERSAFRPLTPPGPRVELSLGREVQRQIQRLAVVLVKR